MSLADQLRLSLCVTAHRMCSPPIGKYPQILFLLSLRICARIRHTLQKAPPLVQRFRIPRDPVSLPSTRKTANPTPTCLGINRRVLTGPFPPGQYPQRTNDSHNDGPILRSRNYNRQCNDESQARRSASCSGVRFPTIPCGIIDISCFTRSSI